MTEAKRDSNSVETMLGVSNTDGVTPRLVRATSSHVLHVDDSTGGSNAGRSIAARDNNSVPTMMAVSTDGVTPIELYVDSDGKLLIQST